MRCRPKRRPRPADRSHYPELNEGATDDERKTFEGGFDSMTQGFGGTWDRLAAYLSTVTSA